jgi:hypothetical protein
MGNGRRFYNEKKSLSALDNIEYLLQQAKAAQEAMTPPIFTPPPQTQPETPPLDAQVAANLAALRLNDTSAEYILKFPWLAPYLSALSKRIAHSPQLVQTTISPRHSWFTKNEATIGIMITRGAEKHRQIKFSISEEGHLKTEKDDSARSNLLQDLLVLMKSIARMSPQDRAKIAVQRAVSPSTPRQTGLPEFSRS